MNAIDGSNRNRKTSTEHGQNFGEIMSAIICCNSVILTPKNASVVYKKTPKITTVYYNYYCVLVYYDICQNMILERWQVPVIHAM